MAEDTLQASEVKITEVPTNPAVPSLEHKGRLFNRTDIPLNYLYDGVTGIVPPFGSAFGIDPSKLGPLQKGLTFIPGN